MAASSSLFDLIESLTKNEKRHFRLEYGHSNANTYYIQLFDYLLSQKSYDEQHLMQHFAGQAILKHLSATKNYLYQQILKSLRSYYHNSRIEIKINNMTTDVILLRDRGLYQQSLKVIKRAKRLCGKYHLYHHMLVLLKIESQLTFNLRGKKQADQFKSLMEEWARMSFTQEKENYAYRLYYTTIYMRTQMPERLDILADLSRQLSENRADLCSSDSFYANYICEAVGMNLAIARRNFALAYEHAKEIMAIWHSNPVIQDAQPNVYRIYLSNYLAAAFRTDHYADFPAYLDKMRSIPTRNIYEEVQQFYGYTIYSLLYFLNTRDMALAKKTIPDIIEGMKRYDSQLSISNKLTFYSNLSTLYMMMGDASSALTWINKLLNRPRDGVRKDLVRMAELQQLLYHYELGNFILLENMLITVRNRLKRRKGLTPLEKLVFQHLRKLIYTTGAARKHQLADFLADLDQVVDKRQMGYEEILEWVKGMQQKQVIKNGNR